MTVYLISKFADPIFAFTIGSSAALLRIRRDQQDKLSGRSQSENPHPTVNATTNGQPQVAVGDVINLGVTRVKRWWNGDFDGL